jgi:hypothetical protein
MLFQVAQKRLWQNLASLPMPRPTLFSSVCFALPSSHPPPSLVSIIVPLFYFQPQHFPEREQLGCWSHRGNIFFDYFADFSFSMKTDATTAN